LPKFFRPPSDGGLMIPPRKVGDVFVKRLVYLFFYFFLYYYFNYELRGVIGRAMASHAIDPGSNPGHAMYISFFKFVNFYWVTTGYHGLPRVTMGYHGLPRVIRETQVNTV